MGSPFKVEVISTVCATSVIRGARIKQSGNCASSSIASKLSSWRPQPFRVTAALSQPKDFCSGFDTYLANKIRPAQVPKVGRPFWYQRSNAGKKSYRTRSLSIVVLSPPGNISPSRPSSSSGFRTNTALAPSLSMTLACAS